MVNVRLNHQTIQAHGWLARDSVVHMTFVMHIPRGPARAKRGDPDGGIHHALGDGPKVPCREPRAGGRAAEACHRPAHALNTYLSHAARHVVGSRPLLEDHVKDCSRGSSVGRRVGAIRVARAVRSLLSVGIRSRLQCQRALDSHRRQPVVVRAPGA